MTVGIGATLLYAIVASGAARYAPPAGVQAVWCPPDDRDRPSHFGCGFAGGALLLGADGRGEILGPGGRRTGLVIRLAPDESIEDAWCAEFERDPVLILTVTLGDGAAGKVARLDVRTGTVRWQTHVPGFNVGEPLLLRGDLFVTAFSFVARLSLGTGAYRWQHQLDHALGFNSFHGPLLQPGSVVVFRERGIRRRGKLEERELRVDAETGTILSGAEPRR